MIGFTIREARREDCKEIRRLIQASLLCFLLRTLLCGPKYIVFDWNMFDLNEGVNYNQTDIFVWCINIMLSVVYNFVTTESTHSLLRCFLN
jgi:hypothetical protein